MIRPSVIYPQEVYGDLAKNKSFDDLLGAVTKSFSKQAELGLDEVFTLALKHIKEVSRVYHTLLGMNHVRRAL